MLQFIARSIAVNEPVPFVLYWGKGPRNAIGEPEVDCLRYIAALPTESARCTRPVPSQADLHRYPCAS